MATFPCIKGELITDAAQYLMTTSFLSGLSSAAKATSVTDHYPR
jgi:isocitrate lyase